MPVGNCDRAGFAQFTICLFLVRGPAGCWQGLNRVVKLTNKVVRTCNIESAHPSNKCKQSCKPSYKHLVNMFRQLQYCTARVFTLHVIFLFYPKTISKV